ncbi:hypothetical protein [Helicobacter zhangjianzhongii]|uniref:Uncharacterized protein n=1 Tax=Helicobacter zhangjianzhongii TaxID=2974574 RepID=A0ACC6FPJ5_9HELI|nr:MULTISPECIES: hypothetical protein [unclassified Helicobacter]MDL0079120.1 hypothetical protein [Helicobacter sp. CPD2-1]MDL0081148.1 hypothetical protein [Helicobacter sp. XJK30-2]
MACFTLFMEFMDCHAATTTAARNDRNAEVSKVDPSGSSLIARIHF